ncbi:MAG: DNA primase [Acidimicrobiales bacterium]|nr:DNA primase [Acidimicrobiales bacterium]
MGWSREFIERVREATDLTDVAGDYGEAKNAGPGKVKMNCPLPNHSEKTPSCYFQKEFFKCFGCGEGGDCFKFIEMVENVDFNENVERLAKRAGVGSSYPNPPDWTGSSSSGEDGRKDLFFAVAQAAEIFHQRLLDMENRPAQQARKFLKSRRIGSEQSEKYIIGYSYPRGQGPSDSLIRDLKPRMSAYFRKEVDRADSEFDQWLDETLVDAGLAKEYQGQLTDFFFDERIMFTIFDASDKPIGFSGRQLPSGREPKYRNSPNSKIYRKEEVLYGLNWARKNLANNDLAIVSEGCLDVIALHECGLPTAVAPCGTSMTETQVKKLARYTTNFSLCFDSDSAGQKATERFTQWEEDHSLNLTVVELPAGQDPGDYHSNNKYEELVSLIEEAIPFLRWRVNRLLASADLEDIEGRVKVAKAMLQLVKDHPEDMYHDDYVKYVGEITGISYGDLRNTFDGMERTPKRQTTLPPPQEPPEDHYPSAFDDSPPEEPLGRSGISEEMRSRNSHQSLDSAECRVLSLMLHNRQMLENLQLWPKRLAEHFFYEGIYRKIFNGLNGSTAYEEVKSRLGDDESALTLLQELHQNGPLQDLDDARASATVAEVLYWTAKHHYDDRHNNATKSDNIEAVRDLGPVHNHLTRLIDSLDPLSESADYLIEWLDSIEPEEG